MSKKMLIDTVHAEETRVVVVDGQRIEEFDFESQSRKQLRGNIYLAKVTRVEPSLQAAFVEYGGNRHGFLAFNEIHPDYYQIPVADREALLREEAEDVDEPSNGHNGNGAHTEASEGEDAVGDEEDDLLEEAARRRRRLMRRYKIQEVIKRRQILLVQVVKEERGNKGAALTTYLSLAGRYCVLMPNTARGGGISRKITSATDRKRLKGIVNSLDVPEGLGLIVRTAGSARTKAEIKRDYEYLMRLWSNIREVTLSSIAPALIYEEEDLVKRAIRDMYDKDYDGIFVEGEDGYKEARDFMRMLMPSQSKKIQPYRDALPLFVAHKVEDQLSQIHSPVVPLRSGGYLVINQTEALVAIDVNSGKSTRERGIEATALKTNMEAAEEAARQLRLRDLAGLIVIDFIDMDESKNNRAVEKKLKDCLATDRARIQMGKISGFGLMEISRQRRRTGVLEGTTTVCPHCAGLGRIRSVESSALNALRAVEIEIAKNGAGAVTLRLPTEVAIYVLNEKRAYLARLEMTQGLKVTVLADESLGHAEHTIERTASYGAEVSDRSDPIAFAPAQRPARVEVADEDFEEVEDEEEDEDEDLAEAAPRSAATSAESEDSRRRGRRRRRRGGRGENGGERPPLAARAAETDEEDEAGPGEPAGELDLDGDRPKRRRRGRRGGRRLRDETRPASDPYVWTRARAPAGEDPYIWFDPLAAAQAAPTREASRRSEPAAAESAPAPESVAVAPIEVPAATSGILDESLSVQASASEPVETEAVADLPSAIEPPKRRTRARKPRKADTAAEAAPAETVAEGGPSETNGVAAPLNGDHAASAPQDSGELIAAEPSANPEPEPAVEPEPEARVLEVVAALAPEPDPVLDPAEISSPPASPRRGWWRRGG